MKEEGRKLEAIFHAARELSDPDQREIYLRDACRGEGTTLALDPVKHDARRGADSGLHPPEHGRLRAGQLV